MMKPKTSKEVNSGIAIDKKKIQIQTVSNQHKMIETLQKMKDQNIEVSLILQSL